MKSTLLVAIYAIIFSSLLLFWVIIIAKLLTVNILIVKATPDFFLFIIAYSALNMTRAATLTTRIDDTKSWLIFISPFILF